MVAARFVSSFFGARMAGPTAEVGPLPRAVRSGAAINVYKHIWMGCFGRAPASLFNPPKSSWFEKPELLYPFFGACCQGMLGLDNFWPTHGFSEFNH